MFKRYKAKKKASYNMALKESFLSVFDTDGIELRFTIRKKDKSEESYVIPREDFQKAKVHFQEVMDDNLYISDLNGFLIYAEVLDSVATEEMKIGEILDPKNRIN